MTPPKRYTVAKAKYVKLAGSAGIAHRVPISNIGVKNIGSAGCDGFTQDVVLEISRKT